MSHLNVMTITLSVSLAQIVRGAFRKQTSVLEAPCVRKKIFTLLLVKVFAACF